ncbi:MAG: GGDEF domain-containing protein, partial [Deltaproteobacteria bacterium]|nr:GGDEF domain-containing protein [Deltaproteobacteria bacterium]
IRSIDTFARLGGDEFGIIMPETDIEGAMYVARKILKIAEEEPLQIDKNTIKFSVSIGITQLKEGDDKNTIIKRADRAMYLAKDKGSNKTKVLI